ncbi:MAG: hypothetical protein ACLR06_00235 [Christensenellaceae bacterium]
MLKSVEVARMLGYTVEEKRKKTAKRRLPYIPLFSTIYIRARILPNT